MRSLTRSSVPTRCAGQSPDAILRRTVFSETPSCFATSATLRNRSPGRGDGSASPGTASERVSDCIEGSDNGAGPASAVGISRAPLKTLSASCRAINRTRRVRSSSQTALPVGWFAAMGRRLVMGGRHNSVHPGEEELPRGCVGEGVSRRSSNDRPRSPRGRLAIFAFPLWRFQERQRDGENRFGANTIATSLHAAVLCWTAASRIRESGRIKNSGINSAGSGKNSALPFFWVGLKKSLIVRLQFLTDG
jgi:hypothetical protein